MRLINRSVKRQPDHLAEGNQIRSSDQCSDCHYRDIRHQRRCFAAFKSIVFAGLIIFGLGYGLAEVALNVDGSALEHAAGKTMMPALHASFSAGTLIGAGLSSLAILFKVPVLVHLLLIAGIEFILIFTFFRFLPEDTGKKMPSQGGRKSQAKSRKTSGQSRAHC